MPTFAELKKTSDNTGQVRKALEGVAFLAPITAPAVSTLTDAQGAIQTLPSGYAPVGLVTSDGYSFESDTDSEEVTALGYVTPVRQDVTSKTREITFTALEVFKKNVLEVAYGVDLTAVKQGLNGEITFDQPALPVGREYRLVIIAKDGAGANEVYRAKFFPRVRLKEVGEEVWNSEDPMGYELTFSALVDATLGTAERDFIAGPGAKSDTALGFTKGTV